MRIGRGGLCCSKPYATIIRAHVGDKHARICCDVEKPETSWKSLCLHRPHVTVEPEPTTAM
jgi:hypothetical protein